MNNQISTIHKIPGRARLKINCLYKSPEIEKKLSEILPGIENIITAKPNHITGNILIFFNPDIPLESLLQSIEKIVDEIKPEESYDNSHNNSQKFNQLTFGSFIPKDIIPKDIIPNINLNFNLDFLSRFKDLCAVKKNKNNNEKLIKSSEIQSTTHWHLQETQDIFDYFTTNKEYGLSNKEALERLQKYGSNILPEAVPRSKFDIFFDQLKSVPVALLGVAAVISIFTGGAIDAVVITSVVLLNAVIGYVTENQSEKTINSLKSLVRPTAWVIREAQTKEIGAGDIVPGDLILLRPGDYVPADARIIQAKRLSIDESALTGEGVPVNKDANVIHDPNCPICDRLNMCFMGTLVTGGQGLAIVVGTGRFTEMGTIQFMVGEAKPPETPMERQLEEMGTKLVIFSGVLCCIVFVMGLLRGYGVLQMLKTAISLAVAAVPEGLPTVATTTLSLGVKEMRKHKVLIRHLDAIEALGAVQVICLDKTGTITENKMKVVQIRAGKEIIQLPAELKNYDQASVSPVLIDEIMGLLIVSALCNESEVIYENDNFKIHGSPTENALVFLSVSGGLDVPHLREDWPRSKIIHRSERRNYMATIHNVMDGKKLVCVKGSPREVLNLCTHYMKDGFTYELTEDDDLFFQTQNEQMAGEALRVLGMAYSLSDEAPPLEETTDDDDEQITHRLVWLGLVGMTDPIRPGLTKLFPQFHSAGIKTVMITGDQSPTAFAVGKELNISGEPNMVILDSSNIVDMDPVALRALALKTSVFSRVSPGNKLEIVKALQDSNKVVAMTGDGINDSPALRAADIGVAMGCTGTDVAREVADVVLEDDNLETMIIAIKMGRTIYGNVQKSLRFLLSTNLSEIMVSFASNTFGMGQPLTEMQLLWINLVTDIFPGLALAMEQPENDIMERKPRDPHKPIIDKDELMDISREAGMISLTSLGAYGYGIAKYGIGPNATAISFLSITSSQLLHALTCRSKYSGIFKGEKLPSNHYLTLAIGGSFALQGLALFVPGLRSLLGLGQLALTDMLVVGAASTLPFLVNEITKKPKELTEVKND